MLGLRDAALDAEPLDEAALDGVAVCEGAGPASATNSVVDSARA